MNDFFGLPGTNRHIEFRNARLLKMNEDGLIKHERRIYDFTGAAACRSECCGRSRRSPNGGAELRRPRVEG